MGLVFNRRRRRRLRPIPQRYLGQEIGDRYLEETRKGPEAPEEIRVRIRPERWLSADFAKRFQDA